MTDEIKTTATTPTYWLLVESLDLEAQGVAQAHELAHLLGD